MPGAPEGPSDCRPSDLGASAVRRVLSRWPSKPFLRAMLMPFLQPYIVRSGRRRTGAFQIVDHLKHRHRSLFNLVTAAQTVGSSNHVLATVTSDLQGRDRFSLF